MKISKTIFATLLLSLTLLLNGCVKEPMGVDVNLSTEKVEMSLSVTSKALGAGQLYLQGEQVYKSVYVFIFDQTTNKLENADNLQMASVGASKIWRVSQGKKLVYCVVNPEMALVNGFNGLTNSSTPTNLSSMITAYRSVDAVATQQDGLLLTGYAEVEAAVGTVAKVNIEVGYRTGRISLLMRLGEGFGKTVKIDKVEFLDKDGDATISTESTLFGENTTTASVIPSASIPSEGIVISAIQPTIDDNKYDRVWDFYSFPKTLDGGKLKITATVGPETKTYEIPLVKDGQDVSIEPNTVINVLATIYPELETTIQVLGWNLISASADMGRYVTFNTAYWCASTGTPITSQTLTSNIIDVTENGRKFQITCTANINDWYVVLTGDDNNPDIEARKITPITTSAKMPIGTQSITMDIPKLKGYESYTHVNISIYQDDIYPPSEGKPVKQWRYTQYAGFIPAWYIETLSPNPWSGTTFTDGIFIARNGNYIQSSSIATLDPEVTYDGVDCALLGSGWYLPSVDQLLEVWNRRFPVSYYGSSYSSYIGGVNYWTSTPFDADNQCIINYTNPLFPIDQLDVYFSNAYYRCIRNDKP